MSKYFRLTNLVLVSALSLGVLPNFLEAAHASTGIRYTLIIPIDDLYQEDGSFKPPMKISTAQTKSLLTRTCKEYLGTKPVVKTYLASGKQLNPTPLKPSYKFSSGSWVKDNNGENLYRLRGLCIHTGTITQRLPDSNFYSFVASADFQGSMRTENGYSYTKQQLSKMKNGITETRNGPKGHAEFTPIPDIETPLVSVIECGEGILNSTDKVSEETEEASGEKIGVTYIGVTNGIYRLIPFPGAHDPIVEMIGGNPMYGDKWSVDYESPQSGDIGQASKVIPIFSTWKKTTDTEYKIDLRISYFRDSDIGKKVAKERNFQITINGNCKNAKVVAR